MKKGLFQYIGDSVKILFENRILLFAGLMEVLLMGVLLIVNLEEAMGGSGGGLPSVILVWMVTGFLASFMLAGKIHMIKKVYDPDEEGSVKVGDYFEGMKRFGLKIFRGSILLIVSALLVLVAVIFILGSTGSGFIIVSTLIALLVLFMFVTLWDTILVVDDIDVGSAYKDSISFVKKNFWVVLGLNVFVVLSTTGDVFNPSGLVGNGQDVGVENAMVPSLLYQWIINTFGTVGWVISILMLLVLSVIVTMVFVDLYMDRREAYDNFPEEAETTQ